MGTIDRRLSRLESVAPSAGMTLAALAQFLQAFGHDNVDRLLAGEDGAADRLRKPVKTRHRCRNRAPSGEA